MVHMGIVAMAVFGPVPARFHLMQGRDERDGCFDGIGTLTGIGDMGGQALEVHLKPEHAELGGDEGFGERLGDQRGIGLVTAREAGQCAIAGAVLPRHD